MTRNQPRRKLRGWTGALPAFLLIGLGGALCAAPIAGAQTAAENAGEEMILFESIPSVFGASKYEQSAAEAPASVTVITAEDIQRFGFRTLGAILRSVRGFYTTYDRDYTYVGTRGFSRPGDYNTRFLLIIDGHRTNERIFDAAYFGTEELLNVDLIERVEVIRGPSSSIYGTNAFLGVVNVVTRSGSGIHGGEIAGSAASYGTYEGRATIGQKFAGGFEGLFSASRYDSQGQDLYFEEYDVPPLGGVARGCDGDEAWQLFGKASYGEFRFEGAFASRTKTIPTGSYETIFGDPRSQTKDERLFVTAGWEHELDDRASLTARLSYDFYDYNGSYAYPANLFRDNGYGRWWVLEAQALTRHLARQTILGGFEYWLNTRQDQGAYEVDPYYEYLRDERRSANWAAYVQDEVRLHDHFLLNAGVRYDHYESFGSTVNPRLALIWGDPAKGTLKLLYGQAFRAPNSYELFYDDGGVSQKSNPDLQPETIVTYEFEGTLALKPDLRGILTLYHYEMADIITQITDPGDGLLVFLNEDQVRSSGVELEIAGKLAGPLEGTISYSWQQSEDSGTDGDLVNSPESLAKANLTVPFAADRLIASLEAQYTSGRATLTGESASAFTVVNFTLLARPIGKRLSIAASVYNLFDEAYGDPAGGEQIQTGLGDGIEHQLSVIPQDGRNYRLAVRFAF